MSQVYEEDIKQVSQRYKSGHLKCLEKIIHKQQVLGTKSACIMFYEEKPTCNKFQEEKILW